MSRSIRFLNTLRTAWRLAAQLADVITKYDLDVIHAHYAPPPCRLWVAGTKTDRQKGYCDSYYPCTGQTSPLLALIRPTCRLHGFPSMHPMQSPLSANGWAGKSMKSLAANARRKWCTTSWIPMSIHRSAIRA